MRDVYNLNVRNRCSYKDRREDKFHSDYMLLLLIPVNRCTPTLKLSPALFEVKQSSMRKNARKANFANGARLAGSFRQPRFLSRIFRFHFPTPFLSLFRRFRWSASAHTGESFSLPFSSSCALVSIVPPCASASEIFIPAVAEQSFRHVSPLEDWSISLRALSTRRFAILSLRVVSRSCMPAGEWINAATDGGWV